MSTGLSPDTEIPLILFLWVICKLPQAWRSGLGSLGYGAQLTVVLVSG